MKKLAAYTGRELAAEADPFAKARELGFDCIEIAGMASLCEDVPGIGIAMDIGHAYRSIFCLDGSGTLSDWVDIAAPWVKSIQFNDVKRGADRFVQTAVGRGDVPYDELVPKLLDLDCDLTKSR